MAAVGTLEGPAPAAAAEEQIRRAARVLRIEPGSWLRTLELYAETTPGPSAGPQARLEALHAAFAAQVPDAAPFSGRDGARDCPACLGGPVVPRYARSIPGAAEPLFVYGLCGECGHGLLLSDPEPESLYLSAAYFERQGASGAGYCGYEAEQAWRIAKGRRLLERIARLSGRPLGAVLEVGSGYGFTRAAAASLGSPATGIDPNPAAAAAATRLHGLGTIVGTLASALESGAVRPGIWDTVLYDFVLEHVADPAGELALAAELLAPEGVLALVVPSMAAAETAVFGGAYRSFRSDHRHIFSPDSLARLLARAGLAVSALRSGCTVHLLRGVLTDTELRHLYDAGGGPDLTVLARLTRR